MFVTTICITLWVSFSSAYECQNRTYGYRCQRQCRHCLNRTQCDYVNGTCLQGCEAGFGGRTCNLVNLALRKPAIEENIYIHSNVTAGNAVDGRKSNLHGIGGECSTSALYQPTATWWVDLESVYSIHDIRIYYRTDNVAWGPSNGYTARFLGFSIYVSNTTNKSDGALCYKDRNFTSSTIPAVFTTTCFLHGQYVIYYNERLPGVTYPYDYSNYAFNDLCEVEVYGCLRPGYYSIDCNIPCPDVNCQYCHIETETCQGCKPGYKGHQCELECNDRKYGDGCQRKCGLCLNMTQCDHVDGTCSQGCEAGYQGQMCEQECGVGFYGGGCRSQCGLCSDQTDCSRFNGTCSKGCLPGYRGEMCKEKCTAGFFGSNCQEKCNATCLSCNMYTGLCDKGCYLGWKGNYCQYECDGYTYGNNCQEHCGICRNGEKCDAVTGVCSNGCDTGYTGDNCKETCSNNTYGLLCSLTCGNCLDKQQCHHVTGKCPKGCAVGFQGEKCDKVKCALPSTESADHRSITYSVSALLALCIVAIIFLTFRLCKHERCYQCHQEKQPKDDRPVDNATPTVRHEVNVEDDTAYQELNEVTYQPKRDDLGHTAVNPDIYVNVEGDNSAYQALGEVTQPSLYDTPFQN